MQHRPKTWTTYEPCTSKVSRSSVTSPPVIHAAVRVHPDELEVGALVHRGALVRCVEVRHAGSMRTVILGERPPELEDFLARRRALGQDGHDEVWEGVYHVAPHAHTDHGILEFALGVVLSPHVQRAGLVATTAFNLGTGLLDFRVPDLGVHRSRPGVLHAPTALLVVEVLSPDDESYEKFGFYAAHGVQEILVADPEERWVRCYDLSGPEPVEVDRSEVLDVAMADVIAQIAWPTG